MPGAPAERLLLTLNCVEERVQILLARESALIFHQEWAAPARVMRFLAPALNHALNILGLRMRDLSGVACVRGPGNFTGLRLCLATAYGLAVGAGLPMAGLDYLPLLANGPAALVPGRLVVLTHARRGLVHAQSFWIDNSACAQRTVLAGCGAPLATPRPRPYDEPRIVAVDDAAALQALGGNEEAPLTPLTPLTLLGSGVRRNLERITAELPQAHILDASWDHPQPDILVQAARNAVFHHAPIEPYYLRPCDAEENLEFFAAKRGFSPEAARERMQQEMTGEFVVRT